MAAGRDSPASDGLPFAQAGTARGRSAARGVFVGRGHETAALHTALEDALAGQGRLVLLAGEPGIGKSRLADELSAEAQRRGVDVLWGRCWEAGGAPAYWPWVQSMRAHVRERAPEALRAELASGAGDIAQILPELRELFPDLPAPPAAQSEDARFRLFDAMAMFLRNAAQTHPLVLVLDDLHAADTPSLLLLRFVAGELGQSRILLIGAYRDTEVGPDHPLAATVAELSRERSTSLLQLAGVARADLSQYLERTTGVVAPQDLVVAIHEETEGNPLFFGELVRLLAAEGRLEAPMVAGARRFAIPPGLREVIDRRLDRLPDESRPLLTLASVLGREFTLDALARLSALPVDELRPMLDEALAAGVVGEVPGTFARLRFSHVVIRDVLYDELTAARRVQLHRQVGEELEVLYAHDPEPHLAELAHHFFQGLSGGDVGRTVDYARRAGDRASALLAYEEGARLYRMALRALAFRDPSDEDLRCELLLCLGDAQARAGDVPTAQETFLQAADVARKRALSEQFARAALGYGGRFVWEAARGDTRLVPLLEQALEALGERDSPLRARLLARLAGGPLRDEPDPKRRAALSERAVEIARRLEDPATLAYALDGRYAAIWWPDNLEQRLEVATELARVAREAGDMERELQGRHYRCLALLELGDMPAVYADLQGQAGLADELRQPAQQWYVASVRATLATFEGRFAEAEELVPQALGLGRRAQGPMAFVYFTIHSYLLRREQGRLEEIEDAVAQAAAEVPTYPVLRCLLSHLYAELGQEALARQTFETLFTGEAPVLALNDEWVFGMSLLSDVAAFLGDRPRAGALYELLGPYGRRNAVSTPDGCLGSVSRPLGVLAATLMRWAEAARHFELALEMNARSRARPWVAWTRHDFARMLLERDGPGDRERASALLDEALTTARSLGMAALERKLEGLGGPATAECVFRREGEYWSIAYGGDRCRLKDTKGLRYLATLLASPAREVHCLELVAGAEGQVPRGAAPSARELAEAGLETAGLGDAGELLDAQARKAYKRRLQELEDEVAEAESWNDPERAARARDERDLIAAELVGALGLGGRARHAGSPAERARQSVTKAIKLATERIGRSSPALARHLEATIHTGLLCRYEPDPRAPITWRL
jgi:tetratricopeptide (TPR) repeat protein